MAFFSDDTASVLMDVSTSYKFASIAILFTLLFIKIMLSPKKSEKKYPLPPDGQPFGEFLTNRNGMRAEKQTELVEKYGSIYTIASPLPGVVNQVAINETELVKELCIKQANMYRNPSKFTTRSDAFAKATRQVVGTGVTGLKGGEWEWRKKALLKEFHRNRLLSDERGLLKAVLDEGRILCNELEKAADTGTIIRVDHLATNAAVGVVLFFLFGRRLEFDTDELQRSAKDLIEGLFDRLMSPFFDITKHIPGTSAYKTYCKILTAQKVVDSIVATETDMLLNEYKTGKVHPDRTPGSVMASLIENEPRFRQGGTESMLAEARVFVQAGFETTAHSLAFATGMMAERPDIADQIASEGSKYLTTKDSYYNTDNMKEAIDKVTLVNNFFHEALRLYPLAPALGGECTDDIDIITKNGDKYTLPKGTAVMFFNYTLQRQVSDPDEIRPERWDVAPKDKPFLHTFQTGAHTCPGKPLSLLEGRVFLLLAAMQFKFDFPEGISKVEYQDNMLLRPKDGMPLLVKRR